MAERTDRKWCRECDDNRKFTSARANHILHFLLSVVTVGLWLIVWFFMLFWADWRCSECGAPYKGKARKPPKPAKESAAFKVGKRLRKPAPPDFTPPRRSSALEEAARIEWNTKYGKR